jgi:uncharacterized glyoxalase superfamily protein PhnB
MNSSAFEIQVVFPIFSVRDLDEATAYYRDRLGFTVAWLWGTPPVRAGVRCGSVEIQLVCDPSGEAHGPSVIYCHMLGVDDYYRACVERGAIIHMPLGDRPWGAKDFRVLDPSGNRLGFAQVTVAS